MCDILGCGMGFSLSRDIQEQNSQHVGRRWQPGNDSKAEEKYDHTVLDCSLTAAALYETGHAFSTTDVRVAAP
jgi:hypothetical protein